MLYWLWVQYQQGRAWQNICAIHAHTLLILRGFLPSKEHLAKERAVLHVRRHNMSYILQYEIWVSHQVPLAQLTCLLGQVNEDVTALGDDKRPAQQGQQPSVP
jgi:hypothetical protein